MVILQRYLKKQKKIWEDKVIHKKGERVKKCIMFLSLTVLTATAQDLLVRNQARSYSFTIEFQQGARKERPITLGPKGQLEGRLKRSLGMGKTAEMTFPIRGHDPIQLHLTINKVTQKDNQFIFEQVGKDVVEITHPATVDVHLDLNYGVAGLSTNLVDLSKKAKIMGVTVTSKGYEFSE
jgi:hypothetical protein